MLLIVHFGRILCSLFNKHVNIKLKPFLVDGSYVRMYQCCSTILATNNDDRDIKSLVENFASTYKTKLGNGEDPENSKEERDLLIKYLTEELLR